MSVYRGFHPCDHRHTRAAERPHRPPMSPRPPPTTAPGNSVTRGCFAFARTACEWDHTAHVPQHRASLAQRRGFEAHPRRGLYQWWIPSCCWVVSAHRQTNHTSSNLLFLFAVLSPLGLQEKPSFSASSSDFSPLPCSGWVPFLCLLPSFPQPHPVSGLPSPPPAVLRGSFPQIYDFGRASSLEPHPCAYRSCLPSSAEHVRPCLLLLLWQPTTDVVA